MFLGLQNLNTQAQNITLPSGPKTVLMAFEEIEKQASMTIAYNESIIDIKRTFNENVTNKPLSEVLAIILKGTGATYMIQGERIIIAASQQTSMQQQDRKEVTGTIIDSNGNALAGVTVVVKGTQTGTATDIDGRFSLSTPANAVLSFSYIGFVPQEISLAGRTNIVVTMAEDVLALEDVVIVGYGTQKKVNLTGAVTQIDNKAFENRPVTSTVTALQGTIPGLQITSGNGGGAPNYDIGVNVRGTTSVNGGSPLVLIDGIESSLRLLNPADIESVSVLKDAAAAAVYGVRAAFGVVLITTKRGKAGKLTVDYSGNTGWARATVMPEFVDNSYDHAFFVNQALANNNAAPLYNAQRMEAVKARYEDPSLPDYIFIGQQYYQVGYYDAMEELIKRTTFRQTHNLNLSGGSGNTTFYTSMSYHNEEGFLKINPPVYNRYNARLRVDNNSYDWLKLSFSAAYNTSNYNTPMTYSNDFWRGLLFSSPLNGGQWLGDPAYPEYDKFIGYYFQDQNQVPVLRNGGRVIEDNHEVVMTPSVTITPLKGWSIHADYNYRRSFNNDTKDRKRIDNLINNTANGIVAYADPQNANLSQDYYQIDQSYTNYYSFNAYTDYTVNINKHNIKAMMGFNQELTRYSYNSAKRKLMINPDLPSLSLGTGDQEVSEKGYEVALRGGFGRINYDYDGRYLLELVGRYDGTSRFPKDNRFVFLPSMSVGWRLSEESFMKFAKPLFSDIKLRASYGTLGNQMLTQGGLGLTDAYANMQYYPYIAALSNGTSGSWLFGGDNLQTIINPPSQLAISSLKWEKVTTTNLGLDLAMLNSRLQTEFNVYWRTTSDMLMSQSLPEVLGVTAPKMNLGSLITRGWELSMSWRDNIGKDFSYSIGFNLFDSQAEITKWNGPIGTVTDNYEGKKIGEIWGYETDGFLTANDFTDGDPSKGLKIPQSSISSNWKPGDIKYKDRNGDGVIDVGTNRTDDPGDRFVIGNTTPRYQYGITGDVAWKGISLSFFLQGIGKKDFWNATQEFFPMGTQYYNTQKWWFENSWSEENPDPNSYFARPRARSTQNAQTQTRYLQNASYMRLKNLTIAYQLPSALASKIALSKAQVYVSGENLCEISHLMGPYDPESISGDSGIGSGSFTYPFARTFSLGINLTF